MHRLFLITHPVPASPGQIHVYDENGNLVESRRNFFFGPGGATIALNPNTRTGFVQIPGQHGKFFRLTVVHVLEAGIVAAPVICVTEETEPVRAEVQLAQGVSPG